MEDHRSLTVSRDVIFNEKMRASSDIRLDLDHVREHDGKHESISSNCDKEESKVDSDCEDTLQDPSDSIISNDKFRYQTLRMKVVLKMMTRNQKDELENGKEYSIDLFN